MGLNPSHCIIRQRLWASCSHMHLCQQAV